MHARSVASDNHRNPGPGTAGTRPVNHNLGDAGSGRHRQYHLPATSSPPGHRTTFGRLVRHHMQHNQRPFPRHHVAIQFGLVLEGWGEGHRVVEDGVGQA